MHANKLNGSRNSLVCLWNVRYWPRADITSRAAQVRFEDKADIRFRTVSLQQRKLRSFRRDQSCFRAAN
jgi:hypothetical protein